MIHLVNTLSSVPGGSGRSPVTPSSHQKGKQPVVTVPVLPSISSLPQHQKIEALQQPFSPQRLSLNDEQRMRLKTLLQKPVPLIKKGEATSFSFDLIRYLIDLNRFFSKKNFPQTTPILTGNTAIDLLVPQEEGNQELHFLLQFHIGIECVGSQGEMNQQISETVRNCCNYSKEAILFCLSYQLQQEATQENLSKIAEQYFTMQSLCNTFPNWTDLNHPLDNRSASIGFAEITFKTVVDISLTSQGKPIAMIPGLCSPSAFERDEMGIPLSEGYLQEIQRGRDFPLEAYSLTVPVEEVMQQIYDRILRTAFIDRTKLAKGIDDITLRRCYFSDEMMNRNITLAYFKDHYVDKNKLESYLNKLKKKDSLAVVCELVNFIINVDNLQLNPEETHLLGNAINPLLYSSTSAEKEIPPELLHHWCQVNLLLMAQPFDHPHLLKIERGKENPSLYLIQPQDLFSCFVRFRECRKKYPEISFSSFPVIIGKIEDEKLFATKMFEHLSTIDGIRFKALSFFADLLPEEEIVEEMLKLMPSVLAQCSQHSEQEEWIAQLIVLFKGKAEKYIPCFEHLKNEKEGSISSYIAILVKELTFIDPQMAISIGNHFKDRSALEKDPKAALEVCLSIIATEEDPSLSIERGKEFFEEVMQEMLKLMPSVLVQCSQHSEQEEWTTQLTALFKGKAEKYILCFERLQNEKEGSISSYIAILVKQLTFIDPQMAISIGNHFKDHPALEKDPKAALEVYLSIIATEKNPSLSIKRGIEFFEEIMVRFERTQGVFIDPETNKFFDIHVYHLFQILMKQKLSEQERTTLHKALLRYQALSFSSAQLASTLLDLYLQSLLSLKNAENKIVSTFLEWIPQVTNKEGKTLLYVTIFRFFHRAKKPEIALKRLLEPSSKLDRSHFTEVAVLSLAEGDLEKNLAIYRLLLPYQLIQEKTPSHVLLSKKLLELWSQKPNLNSYDSIRGFYDSMYSQLFMNQENEEYLKQFISMYQCFIKGCLALKEIKILQRLEIVLNRVPSEMQKKNKPHLLSEFHAVNGPFFYQFIQAYCRNGNLEEIKAANRIFKEGLKQKVFAHFPEGFVGSYVHLIQKTDDQINALSDQLSSSEILIQILSGSDKETKQVNKLTQTQQQFGKLREKWIEDALSDSDLKKILLQPDEPNTDLLLGMLISYYPSKKDFPLSLLELFRVFIGKRKKEEKSELLSTIAKEMRKVLEHFIGDSRIGSCQWTEILRILREKEFIFANDPELCREYYCQILDSLMHKIQTEYDAAGKGDIAPFSNLFEVVALAIDDFSFDPEEKARLQSTYVGIRGRIQKNFTHAIQLLQTIPVNRETPRAISYLLKIKDAADLNPVCQILNQFMHEGKCTTGWSFNYLTGNMIILLGHLPLLGKSQIKKMVQNIIQVAQSKEIFSVCESDKNQKSLYQCICTQFLTQISYYSFLTQEAWDLRSYLIAKNMINEK